MPFLLFFSAGHTCQRQEEERRNASAFAEDEKSTTSTKIMD